MKFARLLINAIRLRSISAALWVQQYEQHEDK